MSATIFKKRVKTPTHQVVVHPCGHALLSAALHDVRGEGNDGHPAQPAGRLLQQLARGRAVEHVVYDAGGTRVRAAAELIQPDADGGFVACTRGGLLVRDWVLPISDELASTIDAQTLIQPHANGCFIACRRDTGEKQRGTLQIRNGRVRSRTYL
jgi:hypothetical protein